jgi:hypothetical protein
MYWVKEEDDKERSVGYLFFLMTRMIDMAEYIRKVGTDAEMIKELTDGVPKKQETFPNEW